SITYSSSIFTSDVQAKEIINKSSFYKNFSGTIDEKYNIFMNLSFDKNNIIGNYYYEQNELKSKLKLRGTINKNSVILKEFDNQGNQTGLFKGIYQSNLISGVWSKADGTKTVKFSVNETTSTPKQINNISNSLIKTLVKDKATKKSLIGIQNCSLQWISWSKFGELKISELDGTVFVAGKQEDTHNQNYLTINGRFTEIDTKELKFTGTIITRVSDNNSGQPCKREGEMSFKKSAGRNFWRLSQMQNPCDDLVDYVDISIKNKLN
ncbi:MAG: hypothetical protein H7263_16690, partial [Candidatus Sericytochromatia bacterium]|nr:hypothetical protein [Candidatus Sericytochromatia bacterium]